VHTSISLKNYEDFTPDVIIIDYLELMKTERDMAEYARSGDVLLTGIARNCQRVWDSGVDSYTNEPRRERR
jgi:hypothetical protein